MKQASADDSVGSPHVKVGHRQGFIPKKRPCAAFFLPPYQGNFDALELFKNRARTRSRTLLAP